MYFDHFFLKLGNLKGASFWRKIIIVLTFIMDSLNSIRPWFVSALFIYTLITSFKGPQETKKTNDTILQYLPPGDLTTALTSQNQWDDVAIGLCATLPVFMYDPMEVYLKRQFEYDHEHPNLEHLKRIRRKADHFKLGFDILFWASFTSLNLLLHFGLRAPGFFAICIFLACNHILAKIEQFRPPNQEINDEPDQRAGIQLDDLDRRPRDEPLAAAHPGPEEERDLGDVAAE